MTEEIEKIKQWKYDFAWKQLENAQACNDMLDNKAMNKINFSGILIPIIVGMLVYISDKPISKSWFYVLLTESLIFLLGSIFFALAVLWLRNQGIIRTNDHFKAIKNADYLKIVGGTAQDLADWQELVVDACESKGALLLLSSAFFTVALILIFLGGGCLLFF